MSEQFAINIELLYQELRDLAYKIYDGEQTQEILSDKLRDYAKHKNYQAVIPENFIGLWADKAASRVISQSGEQS